MCSRCPAGLGEPFAVPLARCLYELQLEILAVLRAAFFGPRIAELVQHWRPVMSIRSAEVLHLHRSLCHQRFMNIL